MSSVLDLGVHALRVSYSSGTLTCRAVIEESFRVIEKKYEGREVPLPPGWGGFRLVPETVEFWQGRRSRGVKLEAPEAGVEIGAGRVVLNVHHPSDVIAGWALGYAYVVACFLLVRPVRPITVPDETPAVPGSAR